MRLIQHKKEAWWFYRFLSSVYDRWVNPLFWTPAMRARVLELARLHDRASATLDVGAGTGFTTEGILEHVDPERVTMLDQSPHQLARARAKPALAGCPKTLGDAEALPFATDSFDRYVSAGSVEYWPEPQRAVAEAYRVLRPGGIALLAGPLLPAQPLARALAQVWMLFPTESDYRRWYARAGFADVRTVRVAPEWHAEDRPFALAIAGRKPAAGPPPLALAPLTEGAHEPMGPMRRVRFTYRFVLGSLAGAAFVPLALLATLRTRAERTLATWRRARP